MKRARIIIGANYGDEGKGTVVAHYTKHATGSVLNILTNGGAQRGHSILTESGSITNQHFGSGTYYGADNYYSRFFIINPMQFVKEYEQLLVKPRCIYRDYHCKWTTPYDSMANLIQEQSLKRHASCGMGIWNTIQRTNDLGWIPFDSFVLDEMKALSYLEQIKNYYESRIIIPSNFREVWYSDTLKKHFINDCLFMYSKTQMIGTLEKTEYSYLPYDEFIFENGQGLLLSDEGQDDPSKTPSNTGIAYAHDMLKFSTIPMISAHYVTRPYLTRHGDGDIMNPMNKKELSASIEDDRTNHYNEFQGEFRYGYLNIPELYNRIIKDLSNRHISPILEVTHCDEIDRIKEFDRLPILTNTYSSPLIK